MKHIYISGKIGEKVISEATQKKFLKIQRKLESEGWHVFNPTCQVWQTYLRQWMDGRKAYLKNHHISEYAETLRLDIGTLSECDAIYMLPDFIDSPGAKAEHAFALAVGMQVYYDDELYRDGTLRGKLYQKNRFPWSEKMIQPELKKERDG